MNHRGRADDCGRWEASTFSGEAHVLVQATSDAPFERQVETVVALYEEALEATGFARGDELHVDLFASDLVNQIECLRASALPLGGPVSLRRFPPLEGGSRLALRAWLAPHRRTPQAGGWRLDLGETAWFVLCDLSAPALAGIGAQTTAVFEALKRSAAQAGRDLATELARTWLTVRDIDLNYRGMVAARAEAYAALFSEATRFPASTGIEGQLAVPEALVGLTALFLEDPRPGQLVRLQALGAMPPASGYGVGFDRGLALRFHDRRHLHLSGTASIGPTGAIEHLQNVAAQTAQIVDNLNALLTEAQASLRDLAYLIVYVRDFKDGSAITAALEALGLGEIPRLLLLGSVCRPGWLIEIEGLAIDGLGDVRMPRFLP